MREPDQVEEIPLETLLAWKDGKVGAFEKIVKSTMRRAYAVALGFVGNEEDARDLSQDAYLAAHRARKRFDVNRPFFPWFYKILKNRCLNYLRKRARRREISLDVLEDRGGQSSPENHLLRKERREMVWKALFTLSPEHREVIVLRVFQELSYREISETLGIHEGTVMSRLFYARKAFSEALRGSGAEAVEEGDEVI